MKIHIERVVICKALNPLARAPGFPEESIDVRPEHRAGVIEREQLSDLRRKDPFRTI
jgi:hypothetical protein